eukprot:jgi/Antlo1/2182/1639
MRPFAMINCLLSFALCSAEYTYWFEDRHTMRFIPYVRNASRQHERNIITQSVYFSLQAFWTLGVFIPKRLSRQFGIRHVQNAHTRGHSLVLERFGC